MTIEDILFDKSYLTIFHIPEERLVYLKWKGYASTDQYREGLNFALDIVRDQKVENWLGDLKLMEMILPLDEDWATKVWYPLISQTSLKKMAIVTSLDFLNNAAVKRIVSTTADSTGFETRFYVDVEDARLWLKGF